MESIVCVTLSRVTKLKFEFSCVMGLILKPIVFLKTLNLFDEFCF